MVASPVPGVVLGREAVAGELVGTARVPQQTEVGQPAGAALKSHQQRLQIFYLWEEFGEAIRIDQISALLFWIAAHVSSREHPLNLEACEICYLMSQ